jgi:hypothetical protein
VAAAGLGIAAAAALFFATFGSSSNPVGDLDINPYLDQHHARVSVEPGINFIPAVAPGGSP